MDSDVAGASIVRVAAYTGGVMVPSARARVRQYIEPSSRLGIAVREYPLPWGNILPRPRPAPAVDGRHSGSRTAALTCSWKADVTWVSRQFLPAFAPLQAMAKRPMILDVDDAVWLSTGGHRARDLARASDLVVCGNSFLANQFSRWNANVTVIPTAVNTSWYRPPAARARPRPPWSWAGPAPAATFPFLYSIEGALVRVLQHCSRAKLLLVADRPPQFKRLPESRVEFELWTPRTELAAFARMSIGLMPLADNDWCNGKCSYKMLCYMAAGLPVVVTAAGMNREVLAMGEVGLSAGCEQQWVDALTALLNDADLRRRMGAAGRVVVEERFSLQRLAQQYAVVFHSLGGDLPRGSGSRVVAHRPMTNPVITIAMPFYNSAATLELAIRSLLNQSYGDFELLLCDDGSDDQGLAIARSFDDPRVICWSDGRRLRLAARLNECIDRARGRYLARMDADDIAYPDRLERQMAFLALIRK